MTTIFNSELITQLKSERETLQKQISFIQPRIDAIDHLLKVYDVQEQHFIGPVGYSLVDLTTGVKPTRIQNRENRRKERKGRSDARKVVLDCINVRRWMSLSMIVTKVNGVWIVTHDTVLTKEVIRQHVYDLVKFDKIETNGKDRAQRRYRMKLENDFTIENADPTKCKKVFVGANIKFKDNFQTLVTGIVKQLNYPGETTLCDNNFKRKTVSLVSEGGTMYDRELNQIVLAE